MRTAIFIGGAEMFSLSVLPRSDKVIWVGRGFINDFMHVVFWRNWQNGICSRRNMDSFLIASVRNECCSARIVCVLSVVWGFYFGGASVSHFNGTPVVFESVGDYHSVLLGKYLEANAKFRKSELRKRFKVWCRQDLPTAKRLSVMVVGRSRHKVRVWYSIWRHQCHVKGTEHWFDQNRERMPI